MQSGLHLFLSSDIHSHSVRESTSIPGVVGNGYGDRCSASNWMDGMYRDFEPLNSWSYYDTVPWFRGAVPSEFSGETAVLILSESGDIDHASYSLSDLSTFGVLTALGESSLMIRRVLSEDDIALMGRSVEWLWAQNWIGHIRNDSRCTPLNDHCRESHWAPTRIEH